MKKPLLSLNLAGGGAKGLLTCGFLKAWRDLGLKYDFCFGTSVGSICGLLYHQGDLDTLEEFWLNITQSKVYKSNPISWMGAFGERSSLFNPSPLREMIWQNFNFQKLIANPADFYINTTEFYPEWKDYTLNIRDLKEEEVPEFIMASSSPRIAFPPIYFRDRWLCDGGTINNFALNNAIEAGADIIVVMTPTIPEPHKAKNILEALNLETSEPEYKYLDYGIRYINTVNKIISQCSCQNDGFREVKVIVVRPLKPTGIGTLDFNYKQPKKDLIKYGYDLSRQILEKELLPLL